MVVSKKIFPYTSICIDADLSDYALAIQYSAVGSPSRKVSEKILESLWITPSNPNPYLACLSVRTALDLYLTAKQFPPDSEVIMSAINIPSMVEIVHAHGLKVIPLDIDIDTMAPRVDLIHNLVTSKSRVLLLANIYGMGFPLEKYHSIAARYNLDVIEDWAEGFSGLHYVGHPNTDLALFSFGPIKFYTAFGGCIAKVRDPALHETMRKIYNTYSVQSQRAYLYKILKYLPVYACLNIPWFTKFIVTTFNALDLDYKKSVVGLVRGFPADKLLVSLRYQPSDALLSVMVHRLNGCTGERAAETSRNIEYVLSSLPKNVRAVGMNAAVKNYWLCPVLVDNPEEAILSLLATGIDAYRGATQLDVVEPDDFSISSTSSPLLQHTPLLHLNRLTNPINLLESSAPVDSNEHIKHCKGCNDCEACCCGDLANCEKSSSNLYSDHEKSSQNFHADSFNLEKVSSQSCCDDIYCDHEKSSTNHHCDNSNNEKPENGDDNSENSRKKDSFLQSKNVFNINDSKSQSYIQDTYNRDGFRSDCNYNAIEYLTESKESCCTADTSARYPHNARYVMDHVIYLPINRIIPHDVLECMARAINHALSTSYSAADTDSKQTSKLLMRSKL